MLSIQKFYNRVFSFSLNTIFSIIICQIGLISWILWMLPPFIKMYTIINIFLFLGSIGRRLGPSFRSRYGLSHLTFCPCFQRKVSKLFWFFFKNLQTTHLIGKLHIGPEMVLDYFIFNDNFLPLINSSNARDTKLLLVVIVFLIKICAILPHILPMYLEAGVYKSQDRYSNTFSKSFTYFQYWVQAILFVN